MAIGWVRNKLGIPGFVVGRNGRVDHNKKNEISYFERDKSDGTKSLISRENIFLYHGSIGHLYPIKWITKDKIIIGFEFDSDENLLFRQLGELSEDGTEMEQVCGNLEKVYERIK